MYLILIWGQCAESCSMLKPEATHGKADIKLLWDKERLTLMEVLNVYNGRILVCQKREKKEAFRYESMQG